MNQNVISYSPFVNKRSKQAFLSRRDNVAIMKALKEVRGKDVSGYITQKQIEELEKKFNLHKGLSNAKAQNCDLLEVSKADKIYFMG